MNVLDAGRRDSLTALECFSESARPLPIIDDKTAAGVTWGSKGQFRALERWYFQSSGASKLSWCRSTAFPPQARI